MSLTREIITIQAGNYSNFVGSHWWNIQESSFCYDPSSSLPTDINHDVLFREGLNYKREVTYTPRLVLIDLKENLQSIRKECPLYRQPDEANNPLWEGDVEVIKASPAARNPFLEGKSGLDSFKNKMGIDAEPSYDFNSPGTSWSTFLKTNIHPQSFCLLNHISPEGRNPLETVSEGHEIYAESGNNFIEDSLRKMAEDCNYLQGFQLIFDACDGFSSITDHTLQYLNDEYNRKPSLCFPTYLNRKPPPYTDLKEQMHRLYAISMSLSCMTSHSTMFSPLCLSNDVNQMSEPFQSFPWLDYKANSLYESSGVLAAAIEALTSQYRLKSSKFNLFDVTSAMTMWSRKLVCSSLCLPFPLPADEFLNMMVQSDNPSYFFKSVSPCYNPEGERTLFQSAVLRGVPKSRFVKPSKSIQYNPLSSEEVFGELLNKFSPSSAATATVFEESCSLSFPFPNFFKVNSGILASSLSSQEGVTRIPVAASFSNSDSASSFLKNILSEVTKNSFKDYIKNAESTYEKDEFNETVQNIIGLMDNYRDQ